MTLERRRGSGARAAAARGGCPELSGQVSAGQAQPLLRRRLEAALARFRRPDWRTVIAWIVAAPWLLWAFVRGFRLGVWVPARPADCLHALRRRWRRSVAGRCPLRSWGGRLPRLGSPGCCLLAGLVFPRATGGAEQAEAGRVDLRVVSANIYRGRADMGELMEIVRETDADLLSIQELSPEVVKELDRLGLRRLLPYRAQVVAGDYFGGGLFSRFPMRELEPVRTPPRIKATGELLSMPRAIVVVPRAPARGRRCGASLPADGWPRRNLGRRPRDPPCGRGRARGGC